MEVILSANEKGGACKTANTLLLATCLKVLGYRVLVMDLDPTGNFSQASLPVIPNTVLYDVLNFTVDPTEAICHADICDILPTKRDDSPAITPASVAAKGFPRKPKNRKSLNALFASYFGQPDWEKLVRSLCDCFPDDYDFILLDSPPSDGPIITNCICAADSVLIPCEPSASSVDGLKYFITSAIDANANAELDGLVFSKYDESSETRREYAEKITRLANDEGIRIYKTKIRNSPSVQTAMNNSRSILDYMYRGNGASDAMNFTLEFLRYRELEPKKAYPGVFQDENGEWIFRKNGDKFYVKDEASGQSRTERFRQNMLSDPAFTAEIGKTVFFSTEI